MPWKTATYLAGSNRPAAEAERSKLPTFIGKNRAEFCGFIRWHGRQ